MFANAATKKADATKKQEIKAETNGTTTAGKADKKNQKVTHVTYLLCTCFIPFNYQKKMWSNNSCRLYYTCMFEYMILFFFFFQGCQKRCCKLFCQSHRYCTLKCLKDTFTLWIITFNTCIYCKHQCWLFTGKKAAPKTMEVKKEENEEEAEKKKDTKPKQ